MRFKLNKQIWLCSSAIAAFIVISCHACFCQEPDKTIPRQVALTWQGDTSTTMTITWRTDSKEGSRSLVYAEKIDNGDLQFDRKEARTYTFEQTTAWLHTLELTGLKPDTEYVVEIEHPTNPDRFSFRTIPSERGKRELVFLAGGDSRSRRNVRRVVNEMAARENPDFIVFAGDFINTALSEEQWDEWFDDWHEQMKTADGRRIPVAPAIGNHEVAGSYRQERDKAPFYYNRFITPEPLAYYVLDFGPDLTIITLDSDHTTRVEDQNRWLDDTLQRKNDFAWKLIQYHVAAWPSVRDFNEAVPVKIRENWIPIFEKHDVDLVIEAHDHAFKRTVPIRDNRRDDERGIIYTGDGGWGAPTRDVKDPDEFWWLAEAQRIDHFWKFILSADGRELRVEPVFLGDGFGKPFVLKKAALAN